MRRIFLVSTLLAGLMAGLAMAGTPADAASVSRVRFVVTSLSGRPITIERDIIQCDNNRLDRPGHCTFDGARIVAARYQRTLRVARSHLASMTFVSFEARFRLRVYVNGVKMHDYRAGAVRQDEGRVYHAGIVFLGPGAINRI